MIKMKVLRNYMEVQGLDKNVKIQFVLKTIDTSMQVKFYKDPTLLTFRYLFD